MTDERRPSYADRRRVGGAIASEGFTHQANYAGTRICQWLRDSTFENVVYEGGDDLAVRFGAQGGQVFEHHQVKNQTLDPGSLRQIVEPFLSEFPGTDRRLVVACTGLSPTLQGPLARLGRFLKVQGADQELDSQTRRDIKKTFEKIGLDHLTEFFYEKVEVLVDTVQQPLQTMLGHLVLVEGFGKYGPEELELASEQLLGELPRRGQEAWWAGQLRSFFHKVVVSIHEAAAGRSGKVLLIRHDTFKRPDVPPSRDVLPIDYHELGLAIEVLDEYGRIKSADDVARSARRIVSPEGELRSALTRNSNAPVVYTGIPHIPLAAVVGYQIGDSRTLRPIDFDRDENIFRWPEDRGPLAPRLLDQTTWHDRPGPARVRVSVSSPVREATCPAEDWSLDIHVGVEERDLGVLRREADAVGVVKVLRRELAEHVLGNPEVDSLHIFAAVPVSVAVLIGRMASATGFPGRTWIYNFDGRRYTWRLELATGNVEEVPEQ